MRFRRVSVLLFAAASCTASDTQDDTPASDVEWGLREIGPPVQAQPEWGSVTAVVPVSNDVLAVSDGLARTVTFMDRQGLVIGTTGRKGGGPTEFVHIDVLASFRGDSVIVHDGQSQRLTLVALKGGGRTLPLRISAGTFLRGTVHDSLAIMFGGAGRRSGPAGTFWDSAAVLEVGAAGGRIDTLGILPHRLTAAGPGYPYYLISPHTMVVARGTRICYASSDRRRVKCIDRSAGDSAVVSWSQEGRPVTDQVKRQRLDAQLQKIPPGISPAWLEERLGNALWPDSLPVIGEPLILEADGTLWVREYTLVSEQVPSIWRVFSPAGLLVGMVRTAYEFEPSAVMGNEIWGVWRDSSDVTSVRGFRIDR